MKSSKHNLKKEAILKSGMEIMWTQGFNGTSVKDIVAAAGIPKGSFYFYFDSKESFAREALKAYFEANASQTSDILTDQTLSPLSRLKALYKKRIALVTEGLNYKKGCFASNLAQELAETNEKICGDVCSFLSQYAGPLARCIEEAIQAGELSTEIDPAQMSEFIENSWYGTVFSARTNQDDRFFSTFYTMVFDTILVPKK